MLYGMDTGLYEEETLDFMKNQNLDIWISECTFGNLKLQEEWNTHLCADTFLELLDTFEKNQHDPAGYQNISFPYKSVSYGAS